MSTNSSGVQKFAWRRYARQGLPKRSAKERISDFLEIYGLFDEQTAQEQASRCVQCPNPSCVDGCPLCNPIPAWMQLTAEGRFLEAATVLGSATNLADVCARLCPQERFCEHTCILAGVSEPVAICAIEQFLVQYALAHGHTGAAGQPPNGLRVAVIGSGPDGLACADELAKRGYAVTVYDAGLLPGGLLVAGMPNFKVERSLVEKRVEILKTRGVKFQLGVELGRDIHLERLRSEYDAVYLAVAARVPRSLSIPGGDLAGVMPALTFLLQTNTQLPLEMPRTEFAGKRVLVIGGGDAAIDCARTALRLQAREVFCSYRRDESSMPCTPHEYDNACEEGVEFLFQTTPIEFLSTERGELRAVRMMRTELGESDETGRRAFSVAAEKPVQLDVDVAIVAVGFERSAKAGAGEFMAFKANDWGGLAVDCNQMTNVAGVFAGGDLTRGPSLVLESVRDARRAADGIHNFLSSRSVTASGPTRIEAANG